jgi:hypothetical protein
VISSVASGKQDEICCKERRGKETYNSIDAHGEHEVLGTQRGDMIEYENQNFPKFVRYNAATEFCDNRRILAERIRV